MARPATPQLYGLFEKKPDGSWIRICIGMAYEKDRAVRIFQDALMSFYLGGRCGVRELRAVGHVLPRR